MAGFESYSFRNIVRAGCRLGLALLLLAPAAAQNAKAQSFEAGLTAFRAGDALAAYEIWIVQAEQGDVRSQYSLGKLFDKGAVPIAADPVIASHWYRAAAAKGMPQALNDLGLLYAKGRGVPVDLERAIDLWNSAAKQDYPWAQYNLALAYYRGQGVDKDPEKALALFQQAGEGGLVGAQYALGQFYEKGALVEKDESEALHWYLLAAKQGESRARTAAERLSNAGVTVAKATDSPAPVKTTETAAAPEQTLSAATEVAVPPPPEPQAPKPAAEPMTETVVEKDLEPEPSAESEAAAAPPPVPAVKPQATQQAALPEPAVESASEVPQQVSDETMPALAENGDFGIWLASAVSETEAAAFWQDLRQQHSASLQDWPVAFARSRVDSQTTLYRVVAGRFDDERHAEAACDRLRDADANTFCLVQTAN